MLAWTLHVLPALLIASGVQFERGPGHDGERAHRVDRLREGIEQRHVSGCHDLFTQVAGALDAIAREAAG